MTKIAARIRRLVVSVALVLAAAAAPAEPPEPADAARSTGADPVPGARTREWLDQQRAGHPARPPRGLPAEARDHASERYLDSFTHPIPERFELEALDPGER